MKETCLDPVDRGKEARPEERFRKGREVGSSDQDLVKISGGQISHIHIREQKRQVTWKWENMYRGKGIKAVDDRVESR